MSASNITANLAALKLLSELGSRRKLTPDERRVLLGWSGWGVMDKVLHPKLKVIDAQTRRWRELGDLVRTWLRPEHVEEAIMATPTAFYTPDEVIGNMAHCLFSLGFGGGRVLEPGCGHGAFMERIGHRSVSWTGVEKDPTSARIARLLHPDAKVVNQPLERLALADGSFDAVIGNVPFGDVAITDPKLRGPVPLHSYFLLRSVRALKPGGIAILITSRWTMDARSTAARELLDAEADLLGAVRLPTGWESKRGSDVVADILVVRRREPEEPEDPDAPEAPEPQRGERWKDVRGKGIPLRGSHESHYVELNQYWLDHPEQVLGEMFYDRGAGHGMDLKVRFQGESLEDALRAALKRVVTLAEERSLTWLRSDGDIVEEPANLYDELGREEDSFHIEAGGQIVQIKGGKAVPVARSAKVLSELTHLIRMRDAYVQQKRRTLRLVKHEDGSEEHVEEWGPLPGAPPALLDAESNRDAPEAVELRGALKGLYDEYVRRWGPLNRCTVTEGKPDPETGVRPIRRTYPSMGGFREDPHAMTVMALEWADEETGEYRPADVLLRRLSGRPPRPEHTDSPAEAIALCLDGQGFLDEHELAALLSVSAAEVEDRLGDLAYRDPETDRLVPAAEYLSGDVRHKLAWAQTAAEEDRRWERNVEALRGVQPRELQPAEIKLRLGHPIVPAPMVKRFVLELLRPTHAVTISHEPRAAVWHVEASDDDRARPVANSEWGTERFDAYNLLEHGLVGATPVVKDVLKVDNGSGKLVEREVENAEQTLLAREKLEALQQRFTEWVFEDHERTVELCTEYNRRFNSVVPRKYDGSHLTFPGISPTFEPYQHQRDMVMRAISTSAVGCFHEVGAGKTASALLVARTLRRLGLARKPMLVVPNHLLEQVTRECLQVVPEARILMVSSEDTTAAKRRLFAARCAARDWDLVVITQSAFKLIPVHPAVEREYLANEIE
ncbi:MAG TPA: methyltransferase domain-containing protein, partial [Myxococcaceae bacterium]|nr:methyltransferase domain-containing protein [Myxococcaceae bacterium]